MQVRKSGLCRRATTLGNLNHEWTRMGKVSGDRILMCQQPSASKIAPFAVPQHPRFSRRIQPSPELETRRQPTNCLYRPLFPKGQKWLLRLDSNQRPIPHDSVIACIFRLIPQSRIYWDRTCVYRTRRAIGPSTRRASHAGSPDWRTREGAPEGPKPHGR